MKGGGGNKIPAWPHLVKARPVISKPAHADQSYTPSHAGIGGGERVPSQVVPSNQDHRCWTPSSDVSETLHKNYKWPIITIYPSRLQRWPLQGLRRTTGRSDQVTGASNFLIFQSPNIRKILSPKLGGEKRSSSLLLELRWWISTKQIKKAGNLALDLISK